MTTDMNYQQAVIDLLKQRTDVEDHPSKLQLTELIRRGDQVSWGDHHQHICQAVAMLNRAGAINCRCTVSGGKPIEIYYLPIGRPVTTLARVAEAV